MNAFRSLSLPLFALVAALAGCSAEAGGTAPGAESADDVRANITAEQAQKADFRPGGRFGHAPPVGGPDFLLHAALRAPLDLTAEQRTTIEGLLAQSRPAKPTFDKANALKLAAAVRSNTVSSLTPPGPSEAARAERLTASASAVAKLHDTLSAEQRARLVAEIEKGAAEHHAKWGAMHGERGPRAAHGERGPRAAHGERGPRAAHGERAMRGPGNDHPMTRPGPGAHGPLAMLAGLDLTTEQKEAIKTKLEASRPAPPSAEQRASMKASFEAMRAEMKAKLESFKADNFDATAFVTPPKAFAPPPGVDGRPNELAIITSVLTPAQREALATRIEQGPPALPRRDAPTAK